MANPITSIPGQTTTFVADQADTTYLLNAANSIRTSSLYGIDASADVAGRAFDLEGAIEGATIGLYANSDTSGANAIRLRDTGLISTDAIGIKATGDGDTIRNDGSIASWDSTSYGILADGDGVQISNTGTIRADYGVFLDGDGVISNSGDIIAHGHTTHRDGIAISSASGDRTRIVNSGTVSGSHSLSSGDGRETLVNTGLMDGDIATGMGNDSFINRAMAAADIDMGDGKDRYVGAAGSHFTSLFMGAGNDSVDIRAVGATGAVTIYGGDGDDVIQVSSSDVILVEGTNGGTDTVKSSASFGLGDNFDHLFLTGTADINGTGNGLDNRLTGNAGDNRLSGLGGADDLAGGLGDDLLKGGTGADSFVFKAHGGHDTVLDFQDGTDALNLTAYAGIDAFSDLKGHLQQAGADLVITLFGGDTITLADTALGEITAKDFDF